ncbi:hypothetical protein BX666DRAFT_1873352 [Dichotomocladium elegans]|nr:hypothetical protein BX666DRAFT_1873352 [Dichotomocladium elegans]
MSFTGSMLFVRSDDEDDENQSWEKRLAKKYYDRLFKEYAICELKYYKDGKIALRWRTEREVIMGKGQFICASTRCEETNDLKSWEVNFGYVEDGHKKNELVKVRLCPDCSYKLNYKTQKRAKNRGDEPDAVANEEQDEQQDAKSIWSRPIEKKQERTKEEEFEDYFADLFQ